MESRWSAQVQGPMGPGSPEGDSPVTPSATRASEIVAWRANRRPIGERTRPRRPQYGYSYYTGERRPRRRSRCDSPAVHWRETGPWSNGTTPPSRGGDPGSTPGGSTASGRGMGSWSNRRTPPWRGGGPGATPGDSTQVRRKASELASNPVASGAPLDGVVGSSPTPSAASSRW
jgi:hypothetical protein